MIPWTDVALFAAALVAIVAVVALKGRNGFDETAETTRGGSASGSQAPYGRLVRQAGFEPSSFLLVLWILKGALAVLLPLLMLEFVPPRWGLTGTPVLVLAALLGFFLPDFWLLSVRRERKQKITWSLAYFLDLLVAFLRAGLSLDEAFRRAGRDGFHPSHPLAREINLVAREIDLGKDRAAAFRALYARTGVPAMRGIALALESGTRLGASVEATLRAQADLLRSRRREETLKRVQLASVKALVPVVICGLPLFLVIVFFPAILEILRTFTDIAWVNP
jgi:tight adherence protein C